MSLSRERLTVSEGPSGDQRRLTSVPTDLAPAASSTETDMNAVSSITPLPSTQGLVPRVGEWAAHLEIDWPHGVEQHPRLRHRMQRDLKRICVIDRSVKGLGLTCALHAADRPEAEAVLRHWLMNYSGVSVLGPQR